jgi:hypothetical protein
MFELIALYRATAGPVEDRGDLFEVVLGRKTDWNQACQAARNILANPACRPLRVRIRPVQVALR